MARADRKQTDTIIHLGAEAELWHTTEGRPFATIESGGAHQNLEIESDAFRKWLGHRFWEAKKTAAGADALSQAVEILTATAVYEGTEHEAFIRVARCADSIYLPRMACNRNHARRVGADP